MRFGVLLVSVGLGSLVFAQEKKFDLKLSDIAVHRVTDQVTIDGKVENSGEKSLKKLRMFIEFRDTDHKTISTRTGNIEEKVLDPGDESEFHAQVPDSVRAVDIVFRFEDGSGREIDVSNPGPFTIE